MKAEIRSDGYIHITCETSAEDFALKYLCPIENKPCEKCGQIKMPIIFETLIENKEQKSDSLKPWEKMFEKMTSLNEKDLWKP